MKRLPVVLAALAVAVLAAPVFAQEPTSRAEALRRQREQKAQDLEPPEQSGLERLLFDLESGRLFERLLNPAEGIYPKIGNITSGSGFSIGPGYRHVGLFGGQMNGASACCASFVMSTRTGPGRPVEAIS